MAELLTVKEAAEFLRANPGTVTAWLSKGRLKRVKAGGKTLIRRSELDRFVETCTAAADEGK